WNRGNDLPDLRLVQEAKPDVTASKQALAEACRQVLANGLDLCGVTPRAELR
ncbi:MAG: arginyl-tRNA synthetase, partial [Dinoroseobacter sp.]